MRGEFAELRSARPAGPVEDAFLQERADQLAAHRQEVDGLFARRREAELAYMRAKQQERQEAAQREIEDNLTKDAEEYSKLKIKLENDVQTLQEQLEEMRATYQLNTEKLEYNFRVLTERDNENKSTLAQQKRRQNRLKDALSALVHRYHEADATARRRNDELTEKYRLVTKQYRDLQAKFRHFEAQDTGRRAAVWRMHEDEVRERVDQVLRASRVIHAQQLGWEWRPPNLELLYDRWGTGVPLSALLRNIARAGEGARGGGGGGGGGGGERRGRGGRGGRGRGRRGGELPAAGVRGEDPRHGGADRAGVRVPAGRAAHGRARPAARGPGGGAAGGGAAGGAGREGPARGGGADAVLLPPGRRGRGRAAHGGGLQRPGSGGGEGAGHREATQVDHRPGGRGGRRAAVRGRPARGETARWPNSN
ncbi:unnamed protein product [Heterosigma akashiwo]